MDDLPNLGDERQTLHCAYCTGAPETRDHVPSRVLLDEPYPENLPVVGACRDCNQSFSEDEVYLACLLDAVLAGSASRLDVARAKIARILDERPSLARRLATARTEKNGATLFAVDDAAVRRVALKLARGHALFELNEPQYGEPSWVAVSPLISLEASERERFEITTARRSKPTDASGAALWPEVGSRAMQRLAVAPPVDSSGWLVVQAGRYRYAAVVEPGVVVRMVLSEYLACEVIWD